MNELTTSKGQALAGSKINFTRKGELLEGVVTEIREATVIIRVTEDVKKFLGLDNDLTVVNHANYKVLK